MTELEIRFLELLKKAIVEGESAFNEFMNQPPPAEWIKFHPMAKTKDEAGNSVPAKYMPIERAMWIVRACFPFHNIEVKSVCQVLNSMVTHVRVTLQHPVTKVYLWHDGIGATGIQMDAGANATELSKIKLSGVQMATPASKVYAIKDALEEHYRIFGSNLNHKQIESALADIEGQINEPTMEAKTPTPIEAPTQTPIPAPKVEAQQSVVTSLDALFN